MSQLAVRTVRRLVSFLIPYWVLLFASAGSLHFWQGWIFWGIFSAATLWNSVYLLRRDPDLLERRLRGGPAAEADRRQKIIQAIGTAALVVQAVLAGLDRRYDWSDVPVGLVIVGNVLVAIGYDIVFLTFRENSFAAATIQVSPNQRVVSTGPYRFVRHPMYSGMLLLWLSTPLALGSYRAMVLTPVLVGVLVWRLVEEEKFLVSRLAGYAEYRARTRYRLVPGVW